MLLSGCGDCQSDCCFLFGNGECDDVLLPPSVSTRASRPALGFGSSISFEEAVKGSLSSNRPGLRFDFESSLTFTDLG